MKIKTPEDVDQTSNDWTWSEPSSTLIPLYAGGTLFVIYCTVYILFELVYCNLLSLK